MDLDYYIHIFKPKSYTWDDYEFDKKDLYVMNNSRVVRMKFDKNYTSKLVFIFHPDMKNKIYTLIELKTKPEIIDGKLQPFIPDNSIQFVMDDKVFVLCPHNEIYKMKYKK